MTLPALHPEELLDRARAGDLSADERRALDEHCAACAACRIQRRVVDSPPPSPEDARLAARAASTAAARFLGGPHAGRAVGRSARHRMAAVAGGLLAALAGGLAAATILATRGEEPAVPEAAPAAKRPAPPAVEPPAPTEPADPTAPTEPAGPTVAPLPAGRSPAALFAQANQARRRGAATEAVRLYQELQRGHPRADESALSRVIAGRLLLDRLGEPLAALRQFDAYLSERRKETLREEAMIGRALALGRLGRSDEERRAWRGLLAAYPDSMYSEKARTRLTELDGPR